MTFRIMAGVLGFLISIGLICLVCSYRSVWVNIKKMCEKEKDEEEEKEQDEEEKKDKEIGNDEEEKKDDEEEKKDDEEVNS